MGTIEGLWQGLLFLRVFQSFHYQLCPSSCYPSGWGFFCP